jgi:hypothetical protein
VQYEMRTYAEELKYLEKITPTCYRIKRGFVPNMRVRERCGFYAHLRYFVAVDLRLCRC